MVSQQGREDDLGDPRNLAPGGGRGRGRRDAGVAQLPGREQVMGDPVAKTEAAVMVDAQRHAAACGRFDEPGGVGDAGRQGLLAEDVAAGRDRRQRRPRRAGGRASPRSRRQRRRDRAGRRHDEMLRRRPAAERVPWARSGATSQTAASVAPAQRTASACRAPIGPQPITPTRTGEPPSADRPQQQESLHDACYSAGLRAATVPMRDRPSFASRGPRRSPS